MIILLLGHPHVILPVMLDLGHGKWELLTHLEIEIIRKRDVENRQFVFRSPAFSQDVLDLGIQTVIERTGSVASAALDISDDTEDLFLRIIPTELLTADGVNTASNENRDDVRGIFNLSSQDFMQDSGRDGCSLCDEIDLRSSFNITLVIKALTLGHLKSGRTSGYAEADQFDTPVWFGL